MNEKETAQWILQCEYFTDAESLMHDIHKTMNWVNEQNITGKEKIKWRMFITSAILRLEEITTGTFKIKDLERHIARKARKDDPPNYSNNRCQTIFGQKMCLHS